jgi:hypothetical protein
MDHYNSFGMMDIHSFTPSFWQKLLDTLQKDFSHFWMSAPAMGHDGDDGGGGVDAMPQNRAELQQRRVEATQKKIRGLQSLCTALSMSTDFGISFIRVESFMPVLVGLLRGSMPLSKNGSDPEEGVGHMAQPGLGPGEDPNLLLYACRAITQMMEVIPAAAISAVHCGVVELLCKRLMSIEYIDLAEQCLSALDHLAVEFPATLLRAQALTAVLSHLDFFPSPMQRLSVEIAAKMCKGAPSDTFPFVKKAIPILSNLVQYPDTRLVQSACCCLQNLADSDVFRDGNKKVKVKSQFSAAGASGIAGGSGGPHPADSDPADPADCLTEHNLVQILIQRLSPKSALSSDLSARCLIIACKLLATVIDRSPKLLQEALDQGVIELICELLHVHNGFARKSGSDLPEATTANPDGSTEDGDRVDEAPSTVAATTQTFRPEPQAILQTGVSMKMLQGTISLVDVLLPPLRTDVRKGGGKSKGNGSKHAGVNNLALVNRTGADATEDAAAVAGGVDGATGINGSKKPPVRLEDKRAVFGLAHNKKYVKMLLQFVLPVLLHNALSSIHQKICHRSITAIAKLLAICDSHMLKGMLQPTAMFSFLFIALSSADSVLVLSALDIVDQLLSNLQTPAMHMSLIKEGTIYGMLALTKEKLNQAGLAREPGSMLASQNRGFGGHQTTMAGVPSDHPYGGMPSEQSNASQQHLTNYVSSVLSFDSPLWDYCPGSGPGPPVGPGTIGGKTVPTAWLDVKDFSSGNYGPGHGFGGGGHGSGSLPPWVKNHRHGGLPVGAVSFGYKTSPDSVTKHSAKVHLLV